MPFLKGWTAALLSNKPELAEIEVLNLEPREVRELTLQRPIRVPKPELTALRHLLAANGTALFFFGIKT
jgi:hypothetical protein